VPAVPLSPAARRQPRSVSTPVRGGLGQQSGRLTSRANPRSRGHEPQQVHRRRLPARQVGSSTTSRGRGIRRGGHPGLSAGGPVTMGGVTSRNQRGLLRSIRNDRVRAGARPEPAPRRPQPAAPPEAPGPPPSLPPSPPPPRAPPCHPSHKPPRPNRSPPPLAPPAPPAAAQPPACPRRHPPLLPSAATKGPPGVVTSRSFHITPDPCPASARTCFRLRFRRD